jgi:hypothetical protein
MLTPPPTVRLLENKTYLLDQSDFKDSGFKTV